MRFCCGLVVVCFLSWLPAWSVPGLVSLLVVCRVLSLPFPFPPLRSPGCVRRLWRLSLPPGVFLPAGRLRGLGRAGLRRVRPGRLCCRRRRPGLVLRCRCRSRLLGLRVFVLRAWRVWRLVWLGGLRGVGRCRCRCVGVLVGRWVAVVRCSLPCSPGCSLAGLRVRVVRCRLFPVVPVFPWLPGCCRCRRAGWFSVRGRFLLRFLWPARSFGRRARRVLGARFLLWFFRLVLARFSPSRASSPSAPLVLRGVLCSLLCFPPPAWSPSPPSVLAPSGPCCPARPLAPGPGLCWCARSLPRAAPACSPRVGLVVWGCLCLCVALPGCGLSLCLWRRSGCRSCRLVAWLCPAGCVGFAARWAALGCFSGVRRDRRLVFRSLFGVLFVVWFSRAYRCAGFASWSRAYRFAGFASCARTYRFAGFAPRR